MYKIAFVGVGGRSGAHADAYKHIDGAELVACCARTREHSDKFAQDYGLKSYTSIEEMVRNEKPDMVHVVTMPRDRAETMQIISDLQVPAATVEKPIATDVADWRAISEIAETTNTKFGICHQFRWYPTLVRCREALASGRLGRVIFLDSTAGMDITNQGTHALHYANSLNNDSEVVSVFGGASGWDTADVNHPGPENSEAYITFANEVRMLWATGPNTPRVGDPETTYQHVRIAAYAEKGRVLWEEFGKWEIEGPDGLESGSFGDMKQWWANNLLAQAGFHKDMLVWLEDDSKPCGTNLKRSLHEWKAVLALYASALERRPIHLAGFDPSTDLVARLKNEIFEQKPGH